VVADVGREEVPLPESATVQRLACLLSVKKMPALPGRITVMCVKIHILKNDVGSF
jgi:hypothetical protein